MALPETPIVYLKEDQLRALLNSLSGGAKIHQGIGYEWKDEGVFHLFTTLPKVAPSGYPCKALFVWLEPADWVAVNTNNLPINLETSDSSGTFVSRYSIVVVLCMDDSKLKSKVYCNTPSGVLECLFSYIPDKAALYSRSRGLIESDILESKSVAIVGLGSFGSNIAVELAKAGVGQFRLLDYDRVELHNVTRHVCGTSDLGRLKTDAVSDQIWLKNPYADIQKFNIDITKDSETFKTLLTQSDLVICATDNNPSRFLINDLCMAHQKTVIYGRAITRAEGGDVFIYRSSMDPCYSCLTGQVPQQADEVTNLSQAERNAPAYMSENEVVNTVQVGLSSDIIPLCNMMVKLALTELSRGTASGLDSLESEFVYPYYIWANRRETAYSTWGSFNNKDRMPTILKWYGVWVTKDPACLVCSS